jgi:toxin ParE1/3/4
VTKPVILLPLAQEELYGLYLEIPADNEDAAERWLDAVQRTSRDRLDKDPRSGVRRDYGRPALSGLRMIGVPGFRPYLIFYRVDADAIRIARILHGARDIPNVLDPAD